MKNILIVAAHPDDEVLGAGGAISHHSRSGDRVTIAILGEGITSRSVSRDQADGSQLADLALDAKKAAAIMGCHDVRLIGLPDNRFDSLNLLDVVKVVEKLVEELRPEVVYTHHHGDLNQDHTVTARAVLTACRPLPGQSVRKIYSFEVPSSTGWGFPETPFVPNVFLDISATIQAKADAMSAYRSELRPYPHPRAPEALIERAKAWGSHVGMMAAEPFFLLRELIQR